MGLLRAWKGRREETGWTFQLLIKVLICLTGHRLLAVGCSTVCADQACDNNEFSTPTG